MQGNGNVLIFTIALFILGCVELAMSLPMQDGGNSSPAHAKMETCESEHTADGCFDVKAVMECLDKVEKDSGLTKDDLEELSERRKHTARQNTVCPALVTQASCFKRAHTKCYRDHPLDDCKNLDDLIECYKQLKSKCANFVASNELQMKIDLATQRCEEGHGEHKGEKDFFEKVEACVALSEDYVDQCLDHSGAANCLKDLLETETDLTDTEKTDIQQQIKDLHSWDKICPALVRQGTCFDRKVDECKADFFENDCSLHKETTECLQKVADVCNTKEAREEIQFELDLMPMCDDEIDPNDMDISY